MMRKIHSIFDPSPKVQFKSDEPSLTIQSAKQECDINYILSRFLATGSWSTNGLELGRIPSFGDFTAEFDYQTAQQMIVDAKNAFDALPASVRKRFNNNPAEVLDFLAKEDNRDEAIKLGLVSAPVVPSGDLELVSDPKDGG